MLISVSSSFPFVQHYHPVPQDNVLKIVVIDNQVQSSDIAWRGVGEGGDISYCSLKFVLVCASEHFAPHLISIV